MADLVMIIVIFGTLWTLLGLAGIIVYCALCDVILETFGNPEMAQKEELTWLGVWFLRISEIVSVCAFIVCGPISWGIWVILGFDDFDGTRKGTPVMPVWLRRFSVTSIKRFLKTMLYKKKVEQEG